MTYLVNLCQRLIRNQSHSEITFRICMLNIVIKLYKVIYEEIKLDETFREYTIYAVF